MKGSPTAQLHYRFLTLHHAAGFSASDLADGKVQVKRIQRLHQEGNGWADIGYHFLIDAGGNIYQGRPYLRDVSLSQKPTLVIGAHVAGHNTGNVGICLLGCFHPETNASTCNDVLTQSVEAALVQLCAFFCANYDIAPTNIKGHKDFNSTACPGSSLYPRLPEIRLLVQHVLSAETIGVPGGGSTSEDNQPTISATSDDRWTAALRREITTGASAVTAAQDGLQPGVTASHQMAKTDLQRVLALQDAFVPTFRSASFIPTKKGSRCVSLGAHISPEPQRPAQKMGPGGMTGMRFRAPGEWHAVQRPGG